MRYEDFHLFLDNQRFWKVMFHPSYGNREISLGGNEKYLLPKELRFSNTFEEVEQILKEYTKMLRTKYRMKDLYDVGVVGGKDPSIYSFSLKRPTPSKESGSFIRVLVEKRSKDYLVGFEVYFGPSSKIVKIEFHNRMYAVEFIRVPFSSQKE